MQSLAQCTTNICCAFFFVVFCFLCFIKCTAEQYNIIMPVHTVHISAVARAATAHKSRAQNVADPKSMVALVGRSSVWEHLLNAPPFSSNRRPRIQPNTCPPVNDEQIGRGMRARHGAAAKLTNVHQYISLSLSLRSLGGSGRLHYMFGRGLRAAVHSINCTPECTHHMRTHARGRVRLTHGRLSFRGS